MNNLVTPMWLKENVDDENIVIIDCRFSLMDKEYGKKTYEKEHIKNAQRIDIETQLSSVVKKHGGRHPLPSIEELKNTFEKVGITNNSIVIGYDDGELVGCARLWWILKYLGHKKVYVLDGGIESFKNIGGEVTNEIVNKPIGNLYIDINEKIKVDMKYIKDAINKEDTLIIDSREYERYIGKFEPIDKKCGHISSAKNYYWMNVLNENKIGMKNECFLNDYFEKVKKYKEVIIYCGSGVTACLNSLALSEIGIMNKVYIGSFSDWISYEENEIDIN